MTGYENETFIIAIQTGVPVLAEGEPGTSKTRTTESFAKKCGLEYQCLIGSQHDPVDIMGIPRTNEAGTAFRYVPPEWREKLSVAPKGGLLHLDELTDSPPAVQAAFLQILGDGVPNTLIVATGNPIEQSTNGFALGGPVINRLCMLKWAPPIHSWRHGLLHGWDKIPDNFPILPPSWVAHIPLCRAMVADYTSKMSDQTQKYPKDFQTNPKPFPSLRSWTNAATMLAAAMSVGAAGDIEDDLIEGCVGLAAANGFRDYRKQLNLPDPEKLIADPSSYKPAGLRGDLALIVLGNVIGAIVRNNTKERWLAGWEIISRQCDVAADVACAIASNLHKHRPAGGDEVQVPQDIQKKLFGVLNI